MSTTTRKRYARKKRSAANRISQQRATPWSDSDGDDKRPPIEEGGQTDRQLSDSDSQEDGGPAFLSSAGQPVEPAVTTPAAPAVIPMEALLAITQALKLSNTGNRPEIRPPSFNGEGDLKLFIKQFEDVAEANGWTPKKRTLHIRNQLAGDARGCGHGDS